MRLRLDELVLALGRCRGNLSVRVAIWQGSSKSIGDDDSNIAHSHHHDPPSGFVSIMAKWWGDPWGAERWCNHDRGDDGRVKAVGSGMRAQS